MATVKNKTLFILDVFPIIYRAHFAMINQSLRNSKGLNTTTILGFYNYLFQIVFKERPAYLAAAFDSVSLHRSVALKSYKGNRDSIPEDVSGAVAYVRAILDAMNIKCIEAHGYEADDVIGTIAVKAAQKGLKVFIVSPDKDFAQLVSEHIFLYRPPYRGMNFEILDREGVINKYGVAPEQIPDFLALSGDAADNIPGLPQIGPKTAQKLLSEYEGLEEIMLNKHDQKGVVLKALTEHEEEAVLFKEVASIDTTVDIGFSLKEFKLGKPDVKKVLEILEELEFFKLRERVFSDRLYKKFFIEQEEEASGPENYHGQVILKTVGPGRKMGEIIGKVVKEGKLYFTMYGNKNYIHLYVSQGKGVYRLRFPEDDFPPLLAQVFEEPTLEIVSYDLKPVLKKLTGLGIPVKCKLFDIMLAQYVIDPEENNAFENLLKIYTGKGLNKNLPEVQRRGILTLFLREIQTKAGQKIQPGKEKGLLYNVEFPLIAVLARMELAGVKFDPEVLYGFSEVLKEELQHTEEEIFKMAGERINLKSAKQVSLLLAKIIDPKTARKTKTGQVSTSEAILEELAPNNEIAALILRVRKINKLLSTYTESLPKHIHKDTGRIHPDFKQATTSTGRLSCMEPNLQNLPIKTEEGREVRKALVPENENFLILAADYSQIELRLLAGLSKDPALIEAFRKNKDIHDLTAQAIFNVSKSGITKELRAKAKMVNYGIAYGLSAFGLSRNLGIPLQEARGIIDNYFEEFESIRNFIDKTIELAEEKGYSETLLGRKRYIRDINSRNKTVRKMAERIAINAPIQGLAADIIKIAMINIDQELVTGKFKSRMILQVHDELVFEAYKPELPKLLKIVKEKMESPVDIGVPLEVNIGVGENWMELKKIGEGKALIGLKK